MKKLLLVFSLLLFTISAHSQNKFRIDYEDVSIYDSKTKTWGEWKKGDNTFVININDRGDIAHFKPNGESVIYKKISSNVENNYTSVGSKNYQTIKALDEDGDVFTFQLFDDTSIGLKMIYKNFMVQFSK